MILLFLAAAPLMDRIAPPAGYTRVPASEFGEWLRHLPTLPGKPNVLLYNGEEKANQSAHHLVIDMDVGKRDLQQCADAVIRLRSEWLWSRKKPARFHYTNGELHEARDRKGLDAIFMYAGTLSLEKELTPVTSIEVGDVFIKGGSPGHAMLVVDVAENAAGQRVFLLLQSYMPAQQMHVVVNPKDVVLSSWYAFDFGDNLRTAEWTFQRKHLRRFPAE